MNDHAAIVLAAGSSTRMPGADKLMTKIDGKPMLQHVLEHISTLDLGEVIVVAGANHETVQPLADQHGFRTVHNTDHLSGMGTSIAAGVKALSPDMRAAFIFLGDMPFIPDEICRELSDAVRTQRASIAAPKHNGQRGHPVLFTDRHFPELAKLNGDAGAQAIIARHDIATVPVNDDGVIRDFDTPGDFAGQKN